ETKEGKVIEEGHVALGEGLHGDLKAASLVRPQQRVGEARPGIGPGEPLLHLLGAGHLVAVEGEKDVADLDPGERGGTAGGHAAGHQPGGRHLPEDAVVHQPPGGLEEDVVEAEAAEDEGHGYEGRITNAGRPHWLPLM